MAKTKRTTVFGVLLLLSLCLATPATASPDEVKWSRVNIPTEGSAGNWALASGSDVKALTMAIDGTLYAFVNPSGTSYTLFKSSDDGYSWSYTGKVTGNIVGIATAPHDASIVYYATASGIFKSTDAGNTFTQLPTPGGTGSNNIEITSIDAAQQGDKCIVAVSTRDTDTSQYGGVYILDEEQILPVWTDTNIGNYDALAVTYSPNFASDHQLVAMVTDETDTLVINRIGDSEWGASTGDAIIDNLVPVSACIAFPDDYDATAEDSALFVAIDTDSDSGDVYRINSVSAPANSVATDLDIGSGHGLSNVDVSGLAVAGETSSANLLAGAAGSAQVYFSRDGGRNWKESAKPPTGQSTTRLLMAADFPDSGRAYAATSGSESAVSITQDGGATWNQIGLIDTRITNIVDRIISPVYSQDNTLFMLTSGGEHSLWRTLNGGTRWERVFSSALPGVDTTTMVELSPQYGSGTQVVFLAGVGGGHPAIWQSRDNGQNFVYRITHDPARELTADPSFDINVWAVANDTTLFIGSFDEDKKDGLVYYTADSGWTYSTGTKVGKKPLNTILLSPDYEQDKTILVGNTGGWVYWSNDNGVSFKSLPPNASKAPFIHFTTIAFDPEFGSNNTVYVASDVADRHSDIQKGIYRYVINQSTKWVYTLSMKAPALVALQQDFLVEFNAITGIATPVTFTWSKPADEVTKYDLWIALDDAFEELVKTITVEETGSSVSAVVGPGANIPLEFIPGTVFFWKVRSFSDYPIKCQWSETRRFTVEKLEATAPVKIEIPPPKITVAEPSPPVINILPPVSSPTTPSPPTATSTYLSWTIIGIGAILLISWASLTNLGPKTTAYPPQSKTTIPQLLSPKAGASGVRPKPVFQWSAVTGANSYELLVSTDPSLANPTIIKTAAYALASTAWRCNVSLNYNTTYYWKVRAISLDTQSAWSATGTFTTKPLPPLSSPTPGHRPA